MGDYTTVVVAQADFCAVSESIHGYPPIRLSELSCQLMAACLYPICTVRNVLQNVERKSPTESAS